jgi:excinuclease ABC subunit A
MLQLPEGSKIHLLAPVVRGRKGEYSQMLKNLRAQGFVRVKIDGETYALGEEPSLDKKKKHDIDLFVDRLVIKPEIQTRLADSVETALKFGEGIVKVEVLDDSGKKVKNELLFSEKFSCIECGISFEEIAPRLFSFNSPHGACPECNGLGSEMYFDPERVIPNSKLSLAQGAIAPWYSKTSTFYPNILATLAENFNFSLQTSWEKLPKSKTSSFTARIGDH